jgi:DNA-binding response OmpR family regulator
MAKLLYGGPIQTILVIDDDANILRTLSIILDRRGYRVFAAENCKQAEEQFAGNAVDLVIVDHGLPGVAGSELAKRFKARKVVLVLMLTGNAEILGKPDAVDVLVPKPCSVPNLLAEIEGLFARTA